VFPYLREYLDLVAQMHLWQRVMDENGDEHFVFPNLPDRVLPALLREHNLEAGRVWTFLPAMMDESEVEQMTAYNVPDYDYEQYGAMGNAVIAFIRQHLRSSQTAIGVFDPQILVAEAPLRDGDVLVDEEVYILLSHERDTEQEVRDALRSGGYWNYGILADASTVDLTRTEHTITRGEMAATVTNLQCAVFSAFDDTGNIFWEPSSGSVWRFLPVLAVSESSN